MRRALLFFGALVICISSFAQTIRRVTNLPVSSPGINDAIAASSNGDMIYIEPSTVAYAGFTVNKTLNFIGNGNFLDQNPDTPFEKNVSYINQNVYFEAGSNNSTITGLYFEDNLILTGTNGVQIRRNRLNGGFALNANTSGILIAENYFGGSVAGLANNGTSAQNTVLRNNIVSFGEIRFLKNSVIQNNTVIYNFTNSIIRDNENCVISNNIFDRRTYNAIYNVSGENGGSTVLNNLQIVSASAPLPSPNPDANNNLYTSNFNNVFVVNYPWNANPVKDSNFKLLAGSPAAGIGIGGTDAGAFGGAFPYTLSTLPNIPIITSAITSTTGTNTVPIDVTISVRSN